MILDVFQWVNRLKNKDFKKMRNWVVNNIDTDASAIFRAIYDRMSDKVAPQSIFLIRDSHIPVAYVARGGI